jgi:hypothetical protein
MPGEEVDEGVPETVRECRVFARYLAGVDPADDPEFLRAYERGLASDAFRSACGPVGRFDRFLMRVAARGTTRAWACDAYARVFHPRSALLKKLVLVVALLETRAAYAQAVDHADGGGLAGLVLRAAVQFGTSAVLLIGATLVLVPVRIVLGDEAA